MKTNKCTTCEKVISEDSGKFKLLHIIKHALTKNYKLFWRYDGTPTEIEWKYKKFSKAELEELKFLCYPCHIIITDSLL